MGGRGSSSGSGGGSWISATSVVGSDGNSIDLSGNPLRYGGKDSVLSDAARATLERFEDRRYKMKTEYSSFADANGNHIGPENHGGKGSVGASFHQRATAYAMSHNHPREGGMLGGTFSTGDMDNFAAWNQTVYRATAVEGTYSIAKGAKFDAAGFARYYKSENKALRATYDAAEKAASKAYSREVSRIQAQKGMTSAEKATAYNKAYEDYMKVNAKAFNTFLVGCHEKLIQGQKQYGYSYTLERRRSK